MKCYPGNRWTWSKQLFSKKTVKIICTRTCTKTEIVKIIRTRTCTQTEIVKIICTRTCTRTERVKTNCTRTCAPRERVKANSTGTCTKLPSEWFPRKRSWNFHWNDKSYKFRYIKIEFECMGVRLQMPHVFSKPMKTQFGALQLPRKRRVAHVTRASHIDDTSNT